jgi:heme o synthase
LNRDKSNIIATEIIASSEVSSKVADYVMLTKLKLNIIVVLSSILGYLIVSQGGGSLQNLVFLALGGFLVVCAANALNQVLEKDYDILMVRTSNRPLAAGRMKTSEAVMFAGLACLVGISILALFNPLTALLGMISMILYSFVYTPLKRYSTLAVAVGAIPGALPVLIGASAFEGRLTMTALCLFVIQFLWQFPHFWAIGFIGFEDYNRAGFKLLPMRDDKLDRNLGLSSTMYAILILPIIAFLFFRCDISIIATVVVSILSIVYAVLSYRFHLSFDRTSALKVMFFSFFYLPLVLMAYWLL